MYATKPSTVPETAFPAVFLSKIAGFDKSIVSKKVGEYRTSTG
jgi:hypothetical protein